MEWKLTEKERLLLLKRHKKERDKRVCDRIKAVLAYDEGYSYSEIARILLLDDETIRRHIEDYFSHHKLSIKSGGSNSHLTERQSLELTRHLESRTYLYVKDICHYVEENFNVNYSISGMRQWLQAKGFRYKKPHGVPAKADKERQAEFIAQYEALKANKAENEVIYFADSSHPQHQTRLAFGWIKKGIRKAEKMTACQKRVNLMGAINIENHDIEYRHVDWVNAESIKLFLEQLIKTNPKAKKIHLIWDNAGYHKSKEVMSYVKNTKIELHYLPPYSPNLNPIERLWKMMHEHVTYNQYYQKFNDFTEAILGFFNNIGTIKYKIQKRINDNFQELVTA